MQLFELSLNFKNIANLKLYNFAIDFEYNELKFRIDFETGLIIQSK